MKSVGEEAANVHFLISRVDTGRQRQERVGNWPGKSDRQADPGLRWCPSSLVDLFMDFQHCIRIHSL